MIKRTKRWGAVVGILFLLGTGLYLFRHSILRAAGDLLIVEHSLSQADALFVLGGNPYDRGLEAVRLFEKGYAPRIFCTGKSISPTLQALGKNIPEAWVTKELLVRKGVPTERVRALKVGKSTKNEGRAILSLCREKGYDTAIVVSDKFHTRRVDRTFSPLFEKARIELIVKGAPSTRYRESEWWRWEEGMIMVNNEYVKLFYYWWKYDRPF